MGEDSENSSQVETLGQRRFHNVNMFFPNLKALELTYSTEESGITYNTTVADELATLERFAINFHFDSNHINLGLMLDRLPNLNYLNINMKLNDNNKKIFDKVYPKLHTLYWERACLLSKTAQSTFQTLNSSSWVIIFAIRLFVVQKISIATFLNTSAMFLNL